MHLNFPTVITTDTLAHMCRDEIVTRCKVAFGEIRGGGRSDPSGSDDGPSIADEPSATQPRDAPSSEVPAEVSSGELLGSCCSGEEPNSLYITSPKQIAAKAEAEEATSAAAAAVRAPDPGGSDGRDGNSDPETLAQAASGGGGISSAHSLSSGSGSASASLAASLSPASSASSFSSGSASAASLDWERIVDFPHGSLRLLASRKALHMDFDPPWVRDD